MYCLLNMQQPCKCVLLFHISIAEKEERWGGGLTHSMQILFTGTDLWYMVYIRYSFMSSIWL